MPTVQSMPREILAEAARLPAAPQTLAELSELLEDPVADLRDIARLIRRDAPMAAQILRVSNSVAYGGGGIGSVEDAVARVGFGEVHRVVGCAVTGLVADRDLSFYRVGAEALRVHMVCTGLACEFLSAGTDFHARHAYTAGLLRPLGMMVLDRLARGMGPRVDLFEPSRDTTYEAWEQRFMGVSSPLAAALVLEHGRFAKDVSEAVRQHRCIPGAPLPPGPAALLHLACGVIDKAGLGLPGEAGTWMGGPEMLEAAGVAEARLERCLSEVEARVEGVRNSLR